MSAFETAVVVVAVWAAVTALLARAAVRRNPPAGAFVTVDGVTLHYVAEGRSDARALVLLHGNGAMIQDFVISGVLALAARHYRVIAFDRPGFGHSPRPRLSLWTPSAQARLIDKALDALAIREPIVLGHSWGTLVALALAERRAVHGLVLVSGYYFPTARKDVWFLTGPAIPFLGDLLAYTVAPVVSALIWPWLVRRIFAPGPVPRAFRKGFPKALALRPSQLRAAAEDTAVMIPSAARQSLTYAAIDRPTVVIAGDGDRIVEPEQAPRLNEILPRALLRIERGEGHMLHHAAPERIVDAVRLVDTWPA